MTTALRCFAVVIASAVLLAGCGNDDGDEGAADERPGTSTTGTASGTPDPSGSSSGSASDPGLPGGGDSECLQGEWHLDTADYAAQAETWLASLGIPISSLTIEGHQIVSFAPPADMNIATDMTVKAVVHGQAIESRTQSAGRGDWAWNADTPNTIGVDDWEWTVAPAAADPSAPAVPFVNPEDPTKVVCTATTLSLQGVGAPLVGNFVR